MADPSRRERPKLTLASKFAYGSGQAAEGLKNGAFGVFLFFFMWLGLISGPIVSGFAVVCLYCYSNHRLDRHRHAEIVRELADRHATEIRASA